MSAKFVSPDIAPVAEKLKGKRQEVRFGDHEWECAARLGSTCVGSSNAWPNKLGLQESELVTVKVGTPTNLGGVVLEKIPKEGAICRFCFNVYKYHMLQIKCKCGFTMIHESCAAEWSRKEGNNQCHVCEQDIQNIPIIVSQEHSSSSSRLAKNKGLKTHKRFRGCFCFSF